MKCLCKNGLILLAVTLPALAQQPAQRIPPRMRQQQQTATPAAAQAQQPLQAQVQQPAQPQPGSVPATASARATPKPAGQSSAAMKPGKAATPVARQATAAPTKAVAGKALSTGKKSASKKKKEKEEQPEPIPPATPVAQMTLADLPPSPPQVSYQNGQLLVLSQNSTLSDVLSAIRSRTGAQIEYPASAAQDRVATRLGPGTARDVITQLLAGSKFDYMILGSVQQPGGVQRVVLTLKQGGAGQTQVASMPPQRTPTPAPQVQEDVNPDEDQADNSQVPPEQEPQVAQPSAQGIQPPGAQPGQPTQPGQANGFPAPPFQQPPFQQQAAQPQATPGTNQQPGQGQQVKTPEQLLRELQQMQQQQQQQQQQQGQQPPPPQ